MPPDGFWRVLQWALYVGVALALLGCVSIVRWLLS